MAMMANNQNPFPGLRPFYKDEQGLFFGRETHVAQILQKLDRGRFVAVVGNSGSGKSSLVRAGVLPTLESETNQPWSVLVFRPGQDPIVSLAEALVKAPIWGENRVDADQAMATLTKSNKGLIQVLRSLMNPQQRLLLLVDQFEELFRYQDEATRSARPQSFVDLLLQAIQQRDLPIYAMLTIRSDFLGDCEQFEGLPEAINDGQFLVPRMRRQELQRVIQGPVDLAGLRMAPRLVQQLLSEVGNSPEQLPILQHALNRLWVTWSARNRPDTPIDLDDYKAIGGLSMSLNNHAEEAFLELNTPRLQKVAELVFKAITVKGADNRGIRRPTSIHDLEHITGASFEEITSVADAFRRADRGFVTPSDRQTLSEQSILDLSHESLMRVWKRLVDWVDEEFHSAELYQRITSNALLYERDLAGLWRDPDLQLALDWKAKSSPNAYWAAQYNPSYDVAIRFLEASERLRIQEQLEIQRRRKTFRVAVSIALVALTGLSIWAISERSQSLENFRWATKEKGLAEAQKRKAMENAELAQANEKLAVQQEANALAQQEEAEKQARIAESNAAEALLQKLKAERATLGAQSAEKQALLDKEIAMWERYVADSMRSKATLSEKAAQRMRFKALTQNLAIRSKLIDSVFGSKTLKAQLAVQAYGFAQEYGMETDPVVLEALNQAYRHLYAPSESSIQGHQNSVKCVRYNPRDRAVYSAGNGGQILRHQERAWPAFQTLYSGSELFECMAFEPSSSRMMVATREGRLAVLKTDEPQPDVAWLPSMGIGEIKALEWTERGVFAMGANGLLLKLSSRTLEIEQRLNLGQKALSMVLDPSGNHLYIGGENGRIWQVDSRQMDAAKEWARLPLSRVVSLGMTPDGKRLLVGTDQGYLGAYTIGNVSAKPWVYSGHKASISSIDVSIDSRWVATACLDGCVRLFDLHSPLTAPVEYVEHRSWVYDARFAFEGRELITAGKDRYMHRYEVSAAQIAAAVSLRMNGPLNETQWRAFVGSDIPFEPYIMPVP